MPSVLMIMGIVFILYYIACVLYAGMGASFIWIWLVGGLALVVLGGTLLVCRKHGIVLQIPFSAKCLFQTAIACMAVIFLIGEGLIFSGMLQKGRPDLDYIIVLGCQVKGERPSKALKERLETAKDYLEKNPDTKAILSGGMGTGEMITEAECMYRYLVDAGVDSRRLLIEDTSTTTLENLQNSQNFLDKETCSAGIVTNNFHVYRSVALARKVGYLNVCGIAAPSRTILQPHYLVREFLALMKEILKKNV